MREYPEKFIKTEDVDIAGRERLGSFGIDISHFSNCYILPGLTDVHVHLREPGFLYKETMKTGTLSAAAGGFTDIFSMPNLDPCPDTVENLEIQLAAIERDACVRVYPYGSITMGERGQELSDMERLADHVIAFTDDGRGVASEEMMREAMKRAKALGKLIVAHCEDGLDITCETAPHYLTISNDQVEDDGRFKMNPPIKGPEDREVLLEAIADGTIDMIATDHAPHSRDEKSRGFADSAFGIVGMETAFPVMYTKLVETGIITADRLIQLMCDGPRKRFGLPGTSIASELSSAAPTFAIWDLDSRYRIDPEGFQSMGRSCPFEGWTVTGRCLLTAVDGKVVWRY